MACLHRTGFHRRRAGVSSFGHSRRCRVVTSISPVSLILTLRIVINININEIDNHSQKQIDAKIQNINSEYH